MAEPSFFDNVYEVAKLIPRGRVTSYGAIARYLGSAKSSRAVGYALNGSMGQSDVPAHRVVNRLGMLSGRNHFPSPTAMQDALEAEGIKVVDNQVQKMNDHFWDPSIELSL
ncbi:MAG: MGMT family protein [Bacteroidia bacterium]